MERRNKSSNILIFHPFGEFFLKAFWRDILYLVCPEKQTMIDYRGISTNLFKNSYVTPKDFLNHGLGSLGDQSLPASYLFWQKLI
jgi:hypothetical protein